MTASAQPRPIVRFGPVGYTRRVALAVWPFAVVGALFALLIMLTPRTFDATVAVWLEALRPANGLLRELALASLLLLGGVILLLRRLPPGRALLAFSATLADAFILLFAAFTALFVGFLLTWPVAAALEAPTGDPVAALRGPGLALLSAVLVYLAFAFTHRLGCGRWPGDRTTGLLPRLDTLLHLERLPDPAVRALGAALVVLFAALFRIGWLLG